MLRPRALEIRYVAIGAALVGLIVGLDVTNALAGLNEAVKDALDTAADFGAPGMFLVAVIGNASVLIQVPYTLPLLSAALNGTDLGHMLVLGLAAGLGAGAGELVSYKIADVIVARNPDLPRSRVFQWVDRNVEGHPHLTRAVIFVWAATPLPDDTVIIPLATVRYGIRRLLLPLFLGKLVHNLLIAWVFYEFSDWAAAHLTSQVKTDAALLVVAFFLLVVFYQAEKARRDQRLVPWQEPEASAVVEEAAAAARSVLAPSTAERSGGQTDE